MSASNKGWPKLRDHLKHSVQQKVANAPRIWNYRGCWHQTCPPIDPRPLSGIEPLFPVTRHHHGRPLSYHRKLIGQIFE
ncbi:hypothetical protein MELLADRAFT_96218 [Melampsora larici-populina 98AG31]|uniref:Uncharacterized protein n=1 Tax=Melampsora larici-populina (strain 98AG31 / pathotype 3-4-7) TaxID=747676 RepID=F4SBD8_MELLP|nr:hypothetical protein MELLADRAFT_86345 [Melampsora larici-populina 98AG31]EGF98047.1 hypothetical protein MELLADRAFT_96218 [Melampsora larici-populina 98AG31]